MSVRQPPPLRYGDPLRLWRAGGEACARMPEVARSFWRGIILMYGCFLVLAVLSVILVSRFILEPALQLVGHWIQGMGGAWLSSLSWVGILFFRIIQVVLLGAGVFIALLLALALMGPWIEAMVERLVLRCRGLQQGPSLSFSEVARGVWGSLVASLRGLGLSLVALVLTIVPVVGWIPAAGLNAYLLGRDVRDPYLSVRRTLKDPVTPLDGKGRFWTFTVGLPLLFCGFLPVIGWMLLPWILVRLAVGFAWDVENPD